MSKSIRDQQRQIKTLKAVVESLEKQIATARQTREHITELKENLARLGKTRSHIELVNRSNPMVPSH